MVLSKTTWQKGQKCIIQRLYYDKQVKVKMYFWVFIYCEVLYKASSENWEKYVIDNSMWEFIHYRITSLYEGIILPVIRWPIMSQGPFHLLISDNCPIFYFSLGWYVWAELRKCLLHSSNYNSIFWKTRIMYPQYFQKV